MRATKHTIRVRSPASGKLYNKVYWQLDGQGFWELRMPLPNGTTEPAVPGDSVAVYVTQTGRNCTASFQKIPDLVPGQTASYSLNQTV